MNPLSRRGFAQLALRVTALWTTGSRAWSTSDRGLGGTGVVPVDPEDTVGQDRGIGGTGVVGTIRRFGSIVVNGLRVSYPADVRVTIDGGRATPADLRLGQVVHVLAHPHEGRLSTRAIAVVSEVVGPVEALGLAGLTVLGQRVVAARDLRRGLRLGQNVAVFGMRRFDGAIVASLVEARPATARARLVGPVEPSRDGRLAIGGLPVIGLRTALVGRRVVVTGHRSDRALHATSVTVEPAVPFTGADRLSIEGFVVRSGREIRFGSGLTLPAGRMGPEIPDRQAVRAVVSATPGGQRTFTVTGVRREDAARPDRAGQVRQGSGEGERPGTPGEGSGSPPAAPAGSPHGPARGPGGLGGGGRGTMGGPNGGSGSGGGGGGSPNGPSR